MEITIKEKKYELKYTIRALFIYEKLTGKTFTPQTMTDLYVFFYSVILANCPETELTFNDLIDLCDEDINLFRQFNEWLTNEFAKQNQFISEADDKEIDSKKK
nr:hypothetical protein [uncultured Bacteroides sp.]